MAHEMTMFSLGPSELLCGSSALVSSNQAAATRNYSAPTSSAHAATIRIDSLLGRKILGPDRKALWERIDRFLQADFRVLIRTGAHLGLLPYSRLLGS